MSGSLSAVILCSLTSALANAANFSMPPNTSCASFRAASDVPTGHCAGKDTIGVAVGKVIDHYKMAKHFEITITDDDLVIARKTPPAPKPLPITPFHCVPGDLVDSGLVVIATIKFLLNSIARRQRTES
jgi:hypothetical protein